MYLLYCNFATIKNKKVHLFVDVLVSILKIINVTNHTQTKLWILEIINLIGERILASKDLFIENGSKIK